MEMDGKTVISMEEVSLRSNGRLILDGINWTVRRGEHWAIYGLNGSGKTTLLNIAAGYLQPSAGRVSVLSKTFGQYDLRELRKSIGWVSASLREMIYVGETPEEIVISGKEAMVGLFERPGPEDTARARELLEQVGLAYLNGRPYRTLSEGERQRLLIARALFNAPALLILDEPCTGLDLLSREHIRETLECIGEELNSTTIIYVTHRLEDIPPVFRQGMLLRQGRLHSSGPTEAVFNTANLSDYLGRPVHLERQDGRFHLRLIRQEAATG